MDSIHRPVLLKESIELLQLRPGSVVVDCTLGGAGFAEAALAGISPGGRLLALDRDPEAVTRARQRLARFGSAAQIQQRPFSELGEALAEAGLEGADAVMMDLGISSDQLDDPNRGFSFMRDGPLDMRMDPGSGRSAADLVNHESEENLANLIYGYGEERLSRRIARSIVWHRRQAPITTTQQLAQIVRRATPRGGGPTRIDPATRTFQALRIAVNDELGELRSGLEQAIKALSPGGRIGVISFHSLEDKAVKNALNVEAKDCVCPPRQPVCTCAHRATLRLLSNRAIRPGPEELDTNPRSRSARLRGAERII